MFSKPRDGAMTPPPFVPERSVGSGAAFSIIGADVVIVGNVSASVDLHIDGRIEGDVRCAALVLGKGSSIIGSVAAQSARIGGVVEGAIDAGDLMIEASARVVGDVTYDNLRIEQGGHIEGSFRHRSAHSLARDAEPLQIMQQSDSLG